MINDEHLLQYVMVVEITDFDWRIKELALVRVVSW